MPTDKQQLIMTFGAQEQHTADKLLPPGRVLRATDAQQLKTKGYTVRPGTVLGDHPLIEYPDSSYPSPQSMQSAYAAGVAENKVFVVDNYGAHELNPGDSSRSIVELGKWQGFTSRHTVSVETLMPTAGNCPISVLDTTRNYLWVFGMTTDASYAVHMMVYDVTNQRVLLDSTLAGDTQDVRQMRAYYVASTDCVDLIYTKSTGELYRVEYDAAELRATYFGFALPTSGTLVAAPAGGTVYGFDLIPDVGGNIAIGLIYGDSINYGAGAKPAWTLRFNRITGLGLTRVDGGVGANAIRFASLAKYSSDANNSYFVGFDGSAVDNNLWAIKFANATLVVGATRNKPLTHIRYETVATNQSPKTAACWFEAGNLNVLYAGVPRLTGVTSAGFDNRIDTMSTWAWVTDFATDVSFDIVNPWIPGCWPAVEQVATGSGLASRAYVFGYDDGRDLQNSYIARYTTGRFIGRTLYGRGPRLHTRRPVGGVVTTGYTGLTQGNGWTFTDSNNTAGISFVGQQWMGGDVYAAVLVRFSVDAENVPPIAVDSQGAIAPSAWGQRFLPGHVAEVAPMMAPIYITLEDYAATPGSFTAVSHSCSICYAMYAADGRIYRSAPSPLTSITMTAGRSMKVRFLHLSQVDIHPGLYSNWYNSGFSSTNVPYVVEFYVTRAGDTTPRLVATTPTSQGGSSGQGIIGEYVITAPPASDAEILYTFGGAIDNAPVPPFRCAVEWSNRLFLTGTDDTDDVWYSKEPEDGKGREFSELFRAFVRGGSGGPTAIGVVDSNYLAVFKRDAIWILSGPGPDGGGNGNYTPTMIRSDIGVNNQRSLATGPDGLYFQGTDGRIYRIGRDASVQYVGRGVEDITRGKVVTCALHVPYAQQIRFYLDAATAAGNVVVWDYGNPTPDDPSGQWYVWGYDFIDGTNIAAAAVVVNGNVRGFTSNGYPFLDRGTYPTYTPHDRDERGDEEPLESSITMKLDLAPIHPFGLMGYGRVEEIQFLGTMQAGVNVQFDLTIETDDDTANAQTVSINGSSPSLQYAARPERQKCSRVRLAFEATPQDDLSPFTLEGFAFGVVPAGGLRRLGAGKRMITT